MIPIQDVVPTRLVPVATYALLVLNVVGYATQVTTSVGLVPAGSSGGSLDDLLDAARSTFLNAMLLPFAINVLFLWLFGGTVEDQLGRLRFVALYVIGGGAAVGVAQTIYPDWHGSSFGGSFAVAAVMGAYFALFPNGKVLMLMPVPVSLHEIPVVVLFTIWCVGQFLAVALLLVEVGASEAAAGSALAGYVLAFVMGVALCLVLRRKERAQIEWWDPRD